MKYLVIDTHAALYALAYVLIVALQCALEKKNPRRANAEGNSQIQR